MQFPQILSLALLVATTNAATCASGAPSAQGQSQLISHWSRLPSGLFAATLEHGYASYSPKSAGKKMGVLQLVNQGAVRRSICILGDCYWLDPKSDCKTNKNIDTGYQVRTPNTNDPPETATSPAPGAFCSNSDWVSAFNTCLACAEPAGLDDTFEDAIERLGLACGYEVQFAEPGDDGDDGSVVALPVPVPVSSAVVQTEIQTVTAPVASSETAVAETRTQAQSSSATSSSMETTATQAGSAASDSPSRVGPEGESSSTQQPDSSGTPDVQSSSSGPSSGPNVGGIAGGIVGAVLGLALIAGVVVFFDRRKKKLRAREPEYMEPRVPEMQRFPSVDTEGESGERPDERYAIAKNF